MFDLFCPMKFCIRVDQVTQMLSSDKELRELIICSKDRCAWWTDERCAITELAANSRRVLVELAGYPLTPEITFTDGGSFKEGDEE